LALLSEPWFSWITATRMAWGPFNARG